MKVLAVDFGERRIGLAISDEAGALALPHSTLERRDDRAAARAIADLAAREGVTTLIVGEPRRLDGSRGDAAARVRRFAERLREASGLPCELVEETLSTDEARRRLRDAGLDPRRSRDGRARLDEVAAQVLLEEFLSRR